MLLLNADSKAVGEFQQTNFNTSYVVIKPTTYLYTCLCRKYFNTSYVVIKRDAAAVLGLNPYNFNTSYVVIKRWTTTRKFDIED